ncbi:MAG: RES family NAD+ phosphorylase [Deltaproteobacteria bacterium]|nr:RES family NAD+ phosphorylase [Deltaproteobacteria bacterium]
MPLDVDSASVAGVWWRHIPGGGEVHYRAPHPADGRWQRGAVVEALYFADSPETAWAEWYRFLAEFALRPTEQMPRDLWRWRVTLPRVADLRGFRRLQRVGLQVPPPGRAGWGPFQQVGEALHREGWPALIAPSAARPDVGRILCVLRTTRIVAGVRPVPPPRRLRKPPAPPTGMRT